MSVGWRRLSTESAGVGEKRLRLTDLRKLEVRQREIDGGHLFTFGVLCDVVCLDQLKHVSVVTVVTVIHLKSHDSTLFQSH